MKKFLPKIDRSAQQNSYIGKVFNVGRYAVTVEDVIAEGKVYLNYETLQRTAHVSSD